MLTNWTLLLDDDNDDVEMSSKNLHNQTLSVLVDQRVVTEVLNNTS